ncbi:MAG: DUF3570 domain-containing protein [Oligoflexia bacterium]|nr:DUF3570 domain-containing protein [Oligoflexia bacterium]
MRKGKRKLASLLCAALALPGMEFGGAAQAQPQNEGVIARIKYQDYREYQNGGTHRMHIMAPSVMLSGPLSERTEFEFSSTVDVMSGASPFYHNTLTGASELGVSDKRRAVDLKVTHYFERFSIGVGGAISTEDDYFSRSPLVEARVWTPDKLTTLAAGFSFSNDRISSTNNPDLDERRRTNNMFLGVTQVLDQNSVLQSNLALSRSHGYLSDPYKPADRRPEQRNMFAWLTRYNRFFPASEGALHFDYRYTRDNWSLQSHMVEVAWFQPLGEHWLLRPGLRYYSQSSADFYANEFPPSDFEADYSADQRLGNFGSISPSVKLVREFGSGVSVDLKFEYMLQRPNLKLGSAHDSQIDPFHAAVISLGLVKRF